MMAATANAVTLFRDDFEGGFNWTTTNASKSGISTQTANSPSYSMFTQGGVVTVTSPSINTSSLTEVQIDVWVRRGSNAFSNRPENNEDLQFGYVNNSGTFVILETFVGGGGTGEIFFRTYNINAPSALFANFQVRARQTGGSGNNDYWHIDDVIVGSPSPSLIANYRFEELIWNGTAGEVADNTIFSNNATAVGSAIPENVPDTPPGSAIPGNPGTCGIGVFPANSSAAVRDAVDTGVDINSVGDAGTITFWYYSNNAWIGGGNRQLFDASGTSGGGRHFQLTLLNTGVLRFSLEDQAGANFNVETPAQGFSASQWAHIAVTWDMPNDQLQILVNGGTPVTATPNTGGSLPNQLISLYIGDNRSNNIENGGSGNSANGGIDEFRLYGNVLTQSEIQTVRDETHACAVLSEWRFEEAAWNGSVGEVMDENGVYNATAASLATPPTTDDTTPAIVTDPGTCRYGVFTRANKDYIALPASFPNLGQSENFTVTAWIRTTDNTRSGQRIMVDDENNSSGWGFSLGDGGTGRLRFFARGLPGTFILDTGNVVANNNWYFVAVTVHKSSKTVTIYRYDTSGNLVTASNTYSGTFGFDAGLASIGGETNSSGENNSNFGFSGNIDWVRVYQSALSQVSLNALRQDTHPCPVSEPDHYDIDISPGVGITCLPVTVTITAKDASNATVAHTALTTINLASSTGLGTWGAASVGAPTNVVPGAGTADYEFQVGQSTVDIQFNYPVLAGVAPEPVNINITSTPNETTGVAIPAEDDPSVDFHTAALIFNNVTAGNNIIPTQISGKDSDTGPGAATLNIQAVRASDDDPSVCQPIFSNGAVVSIDLGAECRNPAQCEGLQMNITNSAPATSSGVDIATSDDNGNLQTVAAYTSVDLQFGANSDATIVLNYPDAGLMQLHARYELLLDDGSPSGEYAVGRSGDAGFVVKPAGLCVESTDANSDCSDPTAPFASCSVFRKAGSVDAENFFNLTVRGVTWEAAGETNEQFCTGTNVNTPNFELNTIALTHALVQPAAGPGPGSLGVPSLDIADADLGSETVINQSFSEVGVFTITASPPNYLGETIAASASANIGRFIPDRFSVIMQNTPAFGDACTGFTYQDQPFYYNDTPSAEAPVLQITALNSNGVTTSNYGGDFWRLTGGTLGRDYVDGSATAPAASLSPTTTQSGGFTLGGDTDFDGIGTLTLNAGAAGDEFIYQKAMPLDTPEEPFDADVDVNFLAAGFQDADHNASPTTGIVCFDSTNDNSCDDFTHAMIQGTELRWGRLIISNVFGSELLPLPVPITAQYFSGGLFQTNTLDNCTTYQAADASLGEVSAADNLVPGGAFEPAATLDLAVNRSATSRSAHVAQSDRAGTS